MKIKSGYYVEKTEGYVYLFTEGTFHYLPSDSTDHDVIGTTDFSNTDLRKRCKYIGGGLDSLRRYLVTERIKKEVAK